jgi:hypothetical protein
MDTPTSPATNQTHLTTLWRERLARYAAIGQSVAAFCRSESISEASFYLWRKRLLTSPVGAGGAQPTSTIPPSFIDLGPVADLPTSPSPMREAVVLPPASIDVRLDLGHGVVLHIVRS